MTKEPIVIFVEDYKKMSKEEFARYIKKIWREGYEAGKQEQWGTLNYPNVTWTLDDKVNEITHTYNNTSTAKKQ